ncbi:MAG: hypothetical protein JNL58_25230 [Planctomyces sp.]|nr:hypothetical protein [Planctomyces sp.]
MSLSVMPRDQELFVVLTRCVRMLSIRQIASLWRKPPGSRWVLRRLRKLAAGQLIQIHTINVRRLIPAGPLFRWKPGNEEPDSSSIANFARSRWPRAAQPTMVCVASPITANMMGTAACNLPRLEQRDHDLLLAEVFVRYHFENPNITNQWHGEHTRPKAGYRIKDPDVVLSDSKDRVLQVIESAGSYSARQVERFHDYCAECSLPYELW